MINNKPLKEERQKDRQSGEEGGRWREQLFLIGLLVSQVFVHRFLFCACPRPHRWVTCVLELLIVFVKYF